MLPKNTLEHILYTLEIECLLFILLIRILGEQIKHHQTKIQTNITLEREERKVCGF